MFCIDTQDNAGNGHGWTEIVVRGDVGNTILLGKVILQAVCMKLCLCIQSNVCFSLHVTQVDYQLLHWKIKLFCIKEVTLKT